jgi:hypothetical protein
MNADTSRAPEILRPQDPGVRLLLPIRIESCANLREHWAKRAGRAKAHRMAALAVPRHPLPCVVTITRIAPRKLDDDNLAGGCKALRDGIADRLGVDDGSPLVQWRYDQRKGMPKQYAVEVVIAPIVRERVAPELAL